MRRIPFALALLLLPSFAAAADPQTNPSVQFIDRSVVGYPVVLGHYRLIGASYDPANVPSGVSLDYRLDDAPQHVQFNIYVYPLGRVDPATAVDGAMVEMEGEIRAVERKKIYADVKFSDAVAFDVAEPPSALGKAVAQDGNMTAPSSASSPTAQEKTATGPAPPSSTTAEDPEGRQITDALRAAGPPPRTLGRKRALTMALNGAPKRSLAYVFYRNLFLISVRATEATDAQPDDSFEALVDHAVQDLVPEMSVSNFGKCGTVYVSIHKESSDKNENVRLGALDLAREIGRIERENCAGSGGVTKPAPAGREEQTIVYPAGYWH